MARSEAHETVRGFFRRHGAVRATNAGPSWSTASDETLLDWYRPYWAAVVHGSIRRYPPGCWRGEHVRAATPAERQQMLPLYRGICAEVCRRAKGKDCSPEIFAASLGVRHDMRSR